MCASVCGWYQVGGAGKDPSWLPGSETWNETWTTLLDCPAVSWNTHTRTQKNLDGNVMQAEHTREEGSSTICTHADTHAAGSDGVWSTHAWRWTHTSCQRFTPNITWVRNTTLKETHLTREGYSQAQNTRAQFRLQPHWLQHVSDELQLNTHKHT